jgi:hypothetical protein
MTDLSQSAHIVPAPEKERPETVERRAASHESMRLETPTFIRNAKASHDSLRAFRAGKLLETMHKLRVHHQALDERGRELRLKLIQELSAELLNGWVEARCPPVAPVQERDPIGRVLRCVIPERHEEAPKAPGQCWDISR